MVRYLLMGFLFAYLEGTLAFISPCFLPLLPVYIGYFAGKDLDEDDPKKRRRRVLASAFSFVAGFTTVFILLGIFAGSIGAALTRYTTIVNAVTGTVVIIFGLSFLGLFHIPHPALATSFSGRRDGLYAFLFGVVFSVGWTPCVGAHLAPALMLAASAQNWLLGALLLLTYSFGLGLPLIICAVAIDALKGAFDFIKKHNKTISRVSGVLLIVLGVLMMTGQMTRLFSVFEFHEHGVSQEQGLAPSDEVPCEPAQT